MIRPGGFRGGAFRDGLKGFTHPVLFPKSPAADGWIVRQLAPTTWPRREGGKCGPRVPIGVNGAGGHDRAPMMERLQRQSGPMKLHQLPRPMPPGRLGRTSFSV